MNYQRALQLVFAFNGDVYGDAVFQQLILKPSHVQKELSSTTINCRIDPALITAFTNVLLLDDTECDVSFKDTDPTLYLIYLPSCNIYVSVISCYKNGWYRMTCDFDVNVISQTKSSLYLRSLLHTDSNISITNVIHRIVHQRFCLWSTDSIQDSGDMLLSKAQFMIRDGWCMDDMMLGRQSWIAGKWSMFIENDEYNNMRLQDRNCDRELCQSQNECVICKEVFVCDDVVVNLACNHNFHCVCLEKWVKHIQQHDQHDDIDEDVCKVTCPMCRAKIIHV